MVKLNKIYCEDWLTEIFELCAKKLKDGGRMFVTANERIEYEKCLKENPLWE